MGSFKVISFMINLSQEDLASLSRPADPDRSYDPLRRYKQCFLFGKDTQLTFEISCLSLWHSYDDLLRFISGISGVSIYPRKVEMDELLCLRL